MWPFNWRFQVYTDNNTYPAVQFEIHHSDSIIPNNINFIVQHLCRIKVYYQPLWNNASAHPVYFYTFEIKPYDILRNHNNESQTPFISSLRWIDTTLSFCVEHNSPAQNHQNYKIILKSFLYKKKPKLHYQITQPIVINALRIQDVPLSTLVLHCDSIPANKSLYFALPRSKPKNLNHNHHNDFYHHIPLQNNHSYFAPMLFTSISSCLKHCVSNNKLHSSTQIWQITFDRNIPNIIHCEHNIHKQVFLRSSKGIKLRNLGMNGVCFSDRIILFDRFRFLKNAHLSNLSMKSLIPMWKHFKRISYSGLTNFEVIKSVEQLRFSYPLFHLFQCVLHRVPDFLEALLSSNHPKHERLINKYNLKSVIGFILLHGEGVINNQGLVVGHFTVLLIDLMQRVIYHFDPLNESLLELHPSIFETIQKLGMNNKEHFVEHFGSIDQPDDWSCGLYSLWFLQYALFWLFERRPRENIPPITASNSNLHEFITGDFMLQIMEEIKSYQ